MLIYLRSQFDKVKLVIVLCAFLYSSLSIAQRFEHPRGLVKKSELTTLRSKVKEGIYKDMLDGIKYQYKDLLAAGDWQSSENKWRYSAADLALVSAQAYLLTGEKEWAEKSQRFVNQIIADTEGFLNYESFGLTRAQSLQKVMMAYDYCYDAWGDEYARGFNEKVYPVVLHMSATMGRAANYDMASNWMGVRYGTILFSSLLWDDFENGNEISKNKIAPLEFDAKKRVEDFALANVHEDGWNVESLGYWGYGWGFIYPALISWTNKYDIPVEKFSLNDRMVKAFQAAVTAFVPIENTSTYGIKPDFSDDGTAWGSKWLPYGYYLVKDSTKKRLRYAIDLFNQRKDWKSVRDGAFENILFTNSDDNSVQIPDDWKYFFSPGQGVSVTRNQFKDQNDIVVAFSTTSHRR